MQVSKLPRLLMLLAGVMAVAAAASAQYVQAQSPRNRTKIATLRDTGKVAAENDTAEKDTARPGQIDLKRSLAYVHVGKTGLGHEHGVEGKIKSGAVQIGATANAGSIVFDMTSFAADTDRARKYVGLEGSTSESTRDKVNKNMLGADVLDVAKYPTATFKIVSALHKKTKQGKPVVELKGEFTLHGQTRPLTLFAEPTQKDGQWNLRGDFTIRQTDFGITPYSAALGTVGVADELKIYGDLWIVGDGTTQE